MSAIETSIKELIQLQLRARQLKLQKPRQVLSSVAGLHQSRFRGRGMDYLESRRYQVGDDVRNIDWRITARTGDTYTKLYHEERERPVMLLLDLYPGMYFGTRKTFKSAQAIRAAALIAWATLHRGDHIGALISTTEHHELPPRGGKRTVLKLINHLAKASRSSHKKRLDTQADWLEPALVRLQQVVKPGSMIILLSDFYHLSEQSKRLLTKLRQHNDILAIQFTDPLETALLPAGNYPVTDGLMTGIINTFSKKGKNEYSQWIELHKQQICTLSRELNFPLLRLSTTDTVGDKLDKFFRYPVLCDDRKHSKQ